MNTTADHINSLLQLALAPETDAGRSYLRGLEEAQWPELLALAEAHHVTLRAFEPLLNAPADSVPSRVLRRIGPAIAAEHARIDEVLPVLDKICRACAGVGAPLVVIKSLDHWPDFGDDADVYTNAKHKLVKRVFIEEFRAARKPRTLGDRLASKQTYIVPGVKTHFEAHVRRLGQVGEQVPVAQRFVERARKLAVNGYTFLIPAVEERIIVAALMRMYRHLHIRVCDVVNTGKLIQQDAVDYDELRTAAELGGIWSGVATYLTIVSDFYERFADKRLSLPGDVRAAALFGLDKLSVGKFMQIPMLREASRLYGRQWAQTARRGSVAASMRLMTVPPLVSASSAAHALFGRGLRIW
jgi:hypothetical protein